MAKITMHELAKGMRVNKKVQVNKVSLFTRAHTIAKRAVAKFESYRVAFAWALKKAYEAEWKLIDLIMNDKGELDCTVCGETEKAFEVYQSGADRTFWVPKSAVSVVNGMITDVAEWAFGKFLVNRCEAFCK